MKEDNWISVKDRLPEKAGYYFVVVDEMVASKRKGVIEISELFESADIITMKPILRFQDYVTHWLPLTALPEPPKQ